MAVSPEYRAYIEDLVAPLGHVSTRRMFGGLGTFRDDLMFGLVADDVFYLKADDANRLEFEARGMGPFTYQRAGKPTSLSYWEVPAEVLEDPGGLALWAAGAWEAARRNAKPKKKRNRT